MILLNNKEINITNFPDKTSQVWNIENNFSVDIINDIKFIFHQESEVFQLVQLCNLLRYSGCKYSLHMPFLPYSRQDKEVCNSETFALTSFAFIINSLDFVSVSTIDVHSDKANSLFNEFTSIYPSKYIDQVINAVGPDCLAYPDKGAEDRYINTLKSTPIVGRKVRDKKTGRILNYEIFGDPKDKNILIIDDICDGGMTFILMTKELLKIGAKEVNLYTTHGIYSKGIKVLRSGGISRIFDKIGESI